MQEAQLQTIEIQDLEGDIDDDTVMRFIEYTYSGDYSVPDPDVVQLPDDSRELEDAFKSTLSPPTSPVPNDDFGWGISSSSRKSKKDKKKKRTVFAEEGPCVEPEPYGYARPATPEDLMPPEEHLYTQGISVNKPAEPPQNPAPSIRAVGMDRSKMWTNFCAEAKPQHRPVWMPRSNNDEREDYTSIFLCHARLYKFSDRYSCEKLMDLTLHKLRLTLSQYLFHTFRASDIVELVRYTYAHTTDFESKRDKLRALVLDYVVCYFRELLDTTAFLELLQEGGSLPMELMISIAKLVI